MQSLYIDCVDHYWGKIEKLSRKGDTSERVTKMTKLSEKIHIMLSLIDPQPEMTRLLKRLDNIIVKLITMRTEENTLFSFYSLYSCFLGRSNPILIQHFQEIEGYMKGSCINDKEFNRDGNMDVHSSEENWRLELYKALRERQHFLERAMVSV